MNRNQNRKHGPFPLGVSLSHATGRPLIGTIDCQTSEGKQGVPKPLTVSGTFIIQTKILEANRIFSLLISQE